MGLVLAPLGKKTHSQLVLPKPEKLEPIVLYQYYFLYIVSIYGSRKGKWGERERDNKMRRGQRK